jgi:predicted transposase/invertase (TIGR01784 family)
MIKNSEIAEGSTSKNIEKARQKLAVMNMTEEKRKAYDKYLINMARDRDVVETAKEEGHEDGVFMVVKNAIVEGLPNEIIKRITKFSDEQIDGIRNGLYINDIM